MSARSYACTTLCGHREWRDGFGEEREGKGRKTEGGKEEQYVVEKSVWITPVSITSQ
jgi:hypothetical protein